MKRWSGWLRQHGVSAVGLGLALLVILLCLLAPLVTLYDPAAIDLQAGLQPPSPQHFFGTDQLGRDMFSRVLWAGRSSLLITFIVLSLSLSIGLAVGLVSGYRGGFIDELAMRLTDFFHAVPEIMLALALIGAVGPSTPTLVTALTVTGWVRYARLTRSLVLTLRTSDFVLAAYAVGTPPWQIIRRHLLPAVAGPLAVQLSLDVGAMILSIAGLSFLGLGVQPPTPEWGAMLVEARPFMDYAPHLVFPPGVAVFLMVFGFNALGEGLENRLRPQT